MRFKRTNYSTLNLKLVKASKIILTKIRKMTNKR